MRKIRATHCSSMLCIGPAFKSALSIGRKVEDLICAFPKKKQNFTLRFAIRCGFVRLDDACMAIVYLTNIPRIVFSNTKEIQVYYPMPGVCHHRSPLQTIHKIRNGSDLKRTSATNLSCFHHVPRVHVSRTQSARKLRQSLMVASGSSRCAL